MKFAYPLMLLLVVLATACAGTQHLQQLEQQSAESLRIPLSVGSITVEDLRQQVDPEPLKLPTFSRPNQHLQQRPPLEQRYKGILSQMVRHNLTGGEQEVQVKVLVQEAYKEFSATFSKETERAHVRLTIELYDSAENKLWCSSSGEYFYSSADAQDQRLEHLYQLTLKNVAYTCLKQLRDEAALQSTTR